jgi:hypothetical protein
MTTSIKVTLLFIIISASCFAQSNKENQLKTKIADETCKCLKAKDLTSINTSNEALIMLTSCFMSEKSLPAITELVKLRNATFGDGEIMNTIGQEVGLEMIKINCNEYLVVTLKMMEGTDLKSKYEQNTPEVDSLPAIANDKYIAPETGPDYASIDGKFLRVDNTTEIAKLIIKDKFGSPISFYWLTSFTNEDYLKKPTYYKLNNLSVSYYELELYSPLKKRYSLIRVINDVTALD